MNIKTKIIYGSSFFIMCGLPLSQTHAEIYKCEDSSGKIFYADKLCPNDNIQTELQAVKDPVNGYIPPDFIPEENTVNKKGVVIGNEINKVDQTDSDNTSSKSSGTDQSNRGSGNGNLPEADVTNNLESTANQTESDKIFNEKLKNKSQAIKSKSAKGSDGLENVLVLEPSAKEL